MRTKLEIFERNMAKAKERRNPTPRMKADWQLREMVDLPKLAESMSQSLADDMAAKGERVWEPKNSP